MLLFFFLSYNLCCRHVIENRRLKTPQSTPSIEPVRLNAPNARPRLFTYRFYKRVLSLPLPNLQSPIELAMAS